MHDTLEPEKKVLASLEKTVLSPVIHNRLGFELRRLKQMEVGIHRSALQMKESLDRLCAC